MAAGRSPTGSARKPSAEAGRLLASLAADIDEPALKAALERLGRTVGPTGKSAARR
jgi:hypothetical protein